MRIEPTQTGRTQSGATQTSAGEVRPDFPSSHPKTFDQQEMESDRFVIMLALQKQASDRSFYLHQWTLGILGFALVVELMALAFFSLRSPVRFESHWGGLGRGMGGWSASPSLVAAFFVALTLLAFVGISFEAMGPATASSPDAVISQIEKKLKSPEETFASPSDAGKSSAASEGTGKNDDKK